MDTLLIAEDDKNLRAHIRHTLENDETIILEASKCSRILEILSQHHVDLLVLDKELSDGESKRIIPLIREKSSIPIILLCKDGSCSTKAEYLNLGADDFIDIPFDCEEFKARIMANFRRYKLIPEQPQGESPERAHFSFRGWALDCERMKVLDENQTPVHLTHKEFLLLEYLVQNGGHVIKREDIYISLKKKHYVLKGRALDVKIARLRKKLGDDKRQAPFIETLHGVGYLFNKD